MPPSWWSWLAAVRFPSGRWPWGWWLLLRGWVLGAACRWVDDVPKAREVPIVASVVHILMAVRRLTVELVDLDFERFVQAKRSIAGETV